MGAYFTPAMAVAVIDVDATGSTTCARGAVRIARIADGTLVAVRTTVTFFADAISWILQEHQRQRDT